MARIRSVKPEFWLDRKLVRSLSRDARLMYVALWNLADEHGRLQGDPRYLKGQCFPYDDDLDLEDIERLVGEIAASGRAMRYVVDGDPYLFLPKLGKHQRLEPSKVASRHPDPEDRDASESGADESEPCADRSARDLHGSAPHADVKANEGRIVPLPAATPSESGADESAPRANGSALKPVAGSMEPVAGQRRADDAASNATVLGNALLAEHLEAVQNRPPRRTVSQLGQAIEDLLGETYDPDVIRQALSRYRMKPKAAPGLLHHLVNDVINARPSWEHEQ